MDQLANQFREAFILSLSPSIVDQDISVFNIAQLAKPFAKNVAWETDYDAALLRAKEDGKTIFAYFTRSYAP